MIKSRYTPALVAIILLGVYSFSYSSLQAYRQQVNNEQLVHRGIWNLSDNALLAVAVEFKGMLANYITLEAGANLGTYLVRKKEGGFAYKKREKDWPSIHRMFVASQILDPAFAQTYILMQGHLPWEPVSMVDEAQDFLRKTIEHRPWDWQPYQAMAFNQYYFLNDPATAGKIFLEAAQIPQSPLFLSILGARLAHKGGETGAAIALMQSMLAGKTPDDPGYDRMVKRLNALEGVFAIEQARDSFMKNHDRLPTSIQELKSSMYLQTLPANPYNTDYCMDKDGTVFFDLLNCKDISNSD